jgi:hypothetical protein
MNQVLRGDLLNRIKMTLKRELLGVFRQVRHGKNDTHPPPVV